MKLNFKKINKNYIINYNKIKVYDNNNVSIFNLTKSMSSWGGW